MSGSRWSYVICVDNNEEKIKLMQIGQSPIFEPMLLEIIKVAIQAEQIEFTTDLGSAVYRPQIVRQKNANVFG